MSLRQRDRRALQLGAAAIAVWVVLRFAAFPLWDAWQQSRADLPMRETALIKYRQAVAAAGTEQKTAESLADRLGVTESGLLKSSTPALAAAELQDWVKQLTASHSIEVRSNEFLAIRPAGDGYEQVPLALQFQCRMDQLADFLEDLRSGPKIVGVPRLVINSNGGEDKILNVSMTLAGLIPAKSAPLAR